MTLWFDFTTTIRNQGRSGIAGAEWNIGQALLEATPDLRCFELAGRKGLVEIDPRVRLAGAVYASSSGGTAIVVNVTPTWRDRVRVGLRSRLGRRADPYIRAMSRVYQAPATMRTWLREPRRPRPAARPDLALLGDVVRSDDVVISMGADWDGELAERLLALRQRTGCTIVTMVYDLIPLTHTHLAFHNDPALFTRYYDALLETSDLITCISEQSRLDLVDFAVSRGKPEPNAEVLVLGETPPPPITADDRQDFYLCVGTVERRKNLELVYDALRILESAGRPVPTVVVAGAIGWGNDDFLAEIRTSTTEASRAMVFLGAVDDDVLERLYRTARGLLFPSVFEGWGLPVREAAVRGCPVAISDSPAIRQAAGTYEGATVLPSNDAGPWADYLDRGPTATVTARVRPWSDVAADLLRLVASEAGGAGATPGGAMQSSG
ncbi:MAG: glycosyltransferase [Ilumatobacter sp.]|nr:glycosyltransferase [Ilumatobacter sp.]